MVIHPLAIPIEPPELFRAISRLPGAFFLDTGQPAGADQFSFMGFLPRMQLRIGRDGSAWLQGKPLDRPAFPLALIEALLERPQAPAKPRPVPFAGGLLLALAYEAKNWIEHVPDPATEASRAPVVVASLYDWTICYCHRTSSYCLASWHLTPAFLRKEARKLDRLIRPQLARPFRPQAPAGALRAPASNMSRREYLAKVDRIKRYIEQGDVYQVNLSQRFGAAIGESAAQLYLRMRHCQPVPFGFYADWGDFQTAANSPERFLRKTGRRLTTCPIKGTRGRSQEEKAGVAVAALRGDPKEAAEHVMIVDVERNDLGRVCDTGSVHVRELARARAFALLYHLESVIDGRIRPGASLSQILRATFPSGSVTGAPKIRAMEIIAELEPHCRGFYTGALGYVDHSGDFDLAMGIRTVTVLDGVATYSAGGGVVADSVPEREYEECMVKAKAFFASLGVHPSGEPRFLERAAPPPNP